MQKAKSKRARQSILCQRSPPCGNSPPSDKNRKVHKMCARYREIPDMKLRRGLGLGPIVNWFVPAHVLSAMMLRIMHVWCLSILKRSRSMSVGSKMQLVALTLPAPTAHDQSRKSHAWSSADVM